MSRFVDRSAVERLSLGACQCEGTPHDEDYVEVRRELSANEWTVVASGDTPRTLAIIVSAWNLVDADGDAVPISRETMADLDLATFSVIDRWSGEHLSPPTLPNGSGAPSRNGSRGSASRIQTIPRKP